MSRPAPAPTRRSHTTSSDVARYAGLFAQRTARHALLGDARPDGDHGAARGDLARRRPPRHLDLPARELRRADDADRAGVGAPRRSSTGRPRASRRPRGCILRGDGRRGRCRPTPTTSIVTTGGQQAIDLICKTLIDPGDVVICEAPTYPGAVPVFCSYQADTRQVEMDDEGMRIDELEELLARLDGEGRRPKFIYSVPTFQNPAGVTMSLERRRRAGRARARARDPRGRGQPLRPAALRAASRCRPLY